MQQSRNKRGFTLLEVLIALLVFSLGLMGMAGLLAVSVKTNQSAYLRTQASFLAQAMADRIGANRVALATAAYNGTYTGSPTGSDPCSNGAACSSSQIVQRDKFFWSQQLGNQLPNGSATINCAGALLGSTLQAAAAPFDGLCNMVITWSESTLARGTEGQTAAVATPTTQTFAWVFQP
jgi:type IV pilus assembly protein PilV